MAGEATIKGLRQIGNVTFDEQELRPLLSPGRKIPATTINAFAVWLQSSSGNTDYILFSPALKTRDVVTLAK
jgi:hypothetical protein